MFQMVGPVNQRQHRRRRSGKARTRISCLGWQQSTRQRMWRCFGARSAAGCHKFTCIMWCPSAWAVWASDARSPLVCCRSCILWMWYICGIGVVGNCRIHVGKLGSESPSSSSDGRQAHGFSRVDKVKYMVLLFCCEQCCMTISLARAFANSCVWEGVGFRVCGENALYCFICANLGLTTCKTMCVDIKTCPDTGFVKLRRDDYLNFHFIHIHQQFRFRFHANDICLHPAIYQNTCQITDEPTKSIASGLLTSRLYAFVSYEFTMNHCAFAI